MTPALALLQAIPMRPPDEGPRELPPGMLEALVDRYLFVAYPAVVVGVIGLLVWGIFRAWRSTDLEGLERAEQRAEVLRFLRKHPRGTTAGLIAEALELDPVHVAGLVDELRREGFVDVFRDAQQRTHYYLRPDGSRR